MRVCNLVCIPRVHNKMERLPDGSRGRTPRSPWAAGGWWRTGTRGGKQSDAKRNQYESLLRPLWSYTLNDRTDGWEVRWIHFALNRMGYFIWFDSFYDKDAVMERPWLCRCGRWRGRCGGCCSGWGPSSRPACCEWSLEGECVSVWMKNTRGRNRQSIRALIHEWDDRHETSNTMKLDWTDTYKHR